MSFPQLTRCLRQAEPPDNGRDQSRASQRSRVCYGHSPVKIS
jgi:hypothetical protein